MPKKNQWGGLNLPAQAAKDRARRVRTTQINRVLAHRLRMFSWWRAVMTLWPCGVVNARQAAFILGVSRSRLKQLIAERRLPTVGPMPGDPKGSILIPIDALMGAPNPTQVGRPERWNMGQDWLKERGIGQNQWTYATKSLGISPNLDYFSRIKDLSPPVLSKYLDTNDLSPLPSTPPLPDRR